MEPAEGSRIVLTPRKYPLELRDRAVELVASSGRPIAHIADELGINRETPALVGAPRRGRPRPAP